VVTLIRLFWVRGPSTANEDVKYSFLILEKPFELRSLENFGTSNFDIAKLKQAFPEAYIRSEFSQYCERFCRLLGIENESALRLLHRTQSAKNLGDLNTFLRTFMLEPPKTFEVAKHLVEEFTELNTAHQEVLTARSQIARLLPARDLYQQRETALREKGALNRLRDFADAYPLMKSGSSTYFSGRAISISLPCQPTCVTAGRKSGIGWTTSMTV